MPADGNAEAVNRAADGPEDPLLLVYELPFTTGIYLDRLRRNGATLS